MPEPRDERWENTVDRNFSALFRYHDQDQKTLAGIMSTLEVLKNRPLPCENHTTELNAVKADVDRLKTFRAGAMWVGGMVAGGIIAAVGFVAKLAVSALAASATIKWK